MQQMQQQTMPMMFGYPPMMPPMMQPQQTQQQPQQQQPEMRKDDGGGDSDDSSSDDPDSMAKKQRRSMMKVIVSKSFRVWGGEVRCITRSLRAFMIEYNFPHLDMNIVGELDGMAFDKLFWVVFGIRPDAKLVSLNLVGASIAEVLAQLKKCRARLTRTCVVCQLLQ